MSHLDADPLNASPPGGRGAPVRRVGWLLALAAMAFVTGCASNLPVQTGSAIPEVQETYGIRVESLRLSSAGAMLDLRYRVLDADKAAPMLNGKVQPYLLDDVHGAKLGVPDTPVLGRIRQTSRNNKILTDRSYFVMFGNPGKAVRSGDKVTLLLGEVRITDLQVQ
jgi:hypothetical protein